MNKNKEKAFEQLEIDINKYCDYLENNKEFQEYLKILTNQENKNK